jgi:hypothetical protein
MQNRADFGWSQVRNLQRFRNVRDCVAFTWINEGVAGFYRGLAIALFKSVPASATTFLVYGALSRLP